MQKKLILCRLSTGVDTAWAVTAEPPYREDRDPRFSAFRRALVCFVGATFSDGTKCTEDIIGKLFDSATAAGGTIALLKDHDWTVDSIYGYAEQWDLSDDGKLFATFAVSEQTAAEIDEGRFKNVSIAFTVPDYSVEEVSLVAVPQIRGAAFLEAEPGAEAVADDTAKEPAPAEGEKSEEEAGSERVTVKNAMQTMQDRLVALQEELAAVRSREARNEKIRIVGERVDGLIRCSKLPAGRRQDVIGFASGLADKQIDAFFDLLADLGAQAKTFGGPRISRQATADDLRAVENAKLIERYEILTGRKKGGKK
jgi:hypothetical protein